ncbi:MAG: polyprenyl diphosphate synthase [Minisyncoccota bacterium]
MGEKSIQCVGVIMDGNRRWARTHDKPVFEGHNEGYKKLQEVTGWAREAKIPHVVAYAFSTENWQRSEDEVGYLMKLFRFVIENEVDRMVKERVRIRFVGERTRFSEDIQKGMAEIEAATGKAYDVTLHIAVSYGGRAEILAAVNALQVDGGGVVSEELFSSKLWSYPMPDPDIIIRTGGEMRLSGFLPWQAIYSELFFLSTLWPDFSREEFDGVLAEFQTRERRRGK